MLQKRALRQLDLPVSQWTSSEQQAMNRLVRFLDDGPGQWFRMPEDMLKAHLGLRKFLEPCKPASAKKTSGATMPG